MAAPLLLAVDADAGALQDVDRELRRRYAGDYSISCVRSAAEALTKLQRLSEAGGQVALVLAAQWLPEMSGGELLERARVLHPHAKIALLVPWSQWGDHSTGTGILDSLATGRIDHYVLKPAAAPDERFHQTVSSFLYAWTKSRRTAPHTVHVVGESWSGRAYELRHTLQRCAIPHAFHLAESEDGRKLLAKASPAPELPLIALPDGRVLGDPSNTEIAEAIGATVDPQEREYDVLIVGAGPAGLSAAVTAASEGLRTLVTDDGGIGGQATSSSMIRNYLGFPQGISGGQLAEHAYEQAWLFGASFAFMHRVAGLERLGDRLSVALLGEPPVSARAVVLAVGASYRRLGVPSLEALTGAGVFYGGPVSEVQAMAGKEVCIVGGANSAGQAAVHLARFASRVNLVVRAQSLRAGMSHYLVEELEATPNIDVRLGTEVVDGGGDGRLEYVVLREHGREPETVRADGLFVLIGARPKTEWLPAAMVRDGHGFVRTGPDIGEEGQWPLERRPLPLETSMPGVFAAGDVRHGSVKRVGSAVGEGAVAIQLIQGRFVSARLRREPRPEAAAAVR